ncbi:MAG: hypothetical protein ABIJ57_09520 [Pseudomonadota bacterium]|uniref:Uncharacterized protein n=1 Tax=viral metagenome TaxID=1070528 RepID=A0A6M3J8J9_9ZZZZ
MAVDPSNKKYQERIARIKAANVHSLPTVPAPIIMLPEGPGPFFAYGAVVININNVTYFEYVKDNPADPAPNQIKLYLVSGAFVTILIAFKAKLLTDINFKEE